MKIPLTNVGIVFHTGMFLLKNTVSGESNVDISGLKFGKKIWAFSKGDYRDIRSGKASGFPEKLLQIINIGLTAYYTVRGVNL
ncbi:MAG: hypothetical protein LBL04_07280 [Bacteroidales bacterium]|nr:hypothetical protein [Bacteroidales bacterium]